MATYKPEGDKHLTCVPIVNVYIALPPIMLEIPSINYNSFIDEAPWICVRSYNA